MGGFESSSYGAVIEDCCWTEGTLDGQSCIGGICGAGHATVRRCWANGTVTGDNRVGGLAGVANGSSAVDFCDCYARGPVHSDAGYRIGSVVGFTNAGNFTRCYGTGEVTYDAVDEQIGGFNGGNVNDPTFTDCLYDMTTVGQSDDDGRGTPKISVLMRQAHVFVGWDFADIWRIDPQQNDGYPFLQAFDAVLPDRRGQQRRRYSTHTERRYA